MDRRIIAWDGSQQYKSAKAGRQVRTEAVTRGLEAENFRNFKNVHHGKNVEKLATKGLFISKLFLDHENFKKKTELIRNDK